ncbi:MAG: phosphodiester glycosidase family protein [Labilithrix sp.]
MARKRGRFALFFLLIVGSFLLFLFGRRLVHRPSLAKDNAAGGSNENDASEFDPAAVVEDHRRYKVKTWSFPLARYELTIEDTSMTTAIDGTLAKAEAELVVNGGFFGPDQKPLGLAMSKGAVLSRLSKQMSGGVLSSDGERAQLFPAETYEVADGGTFAIQCRPRLVVDRAPNVKTDDGKRAERTALCLRDGGKVIDVVIIRGSDDGESPGPSLFALAQFLHRSGCESALNLDGGPSTGVAWREDGGVQLLAPRAAVRHVIAFHERP